jgi:hypothetical protein
MGISVKAAAEQVGMTKAGLMKAIKTGKVSATKNNQGEWEIEPVELFRHYQPATTQVLPVSTNSDNNRLLALETQVMYLEQMVADKNETIARLFDTLAMQQQVTLQLEDKQRRGWWNRLLGR